MYWVWWALCNTERENEVSVQGRILATERVVSMELALV